MIRILGLSLVLGLAGCVEIQQAVDSTARRGAKGVVAETLATRFPAVPRELITPFTDCVIDNATAAEIGEFAKDAVTGVDDATAGIVRTVLSRPETLSCVGATAATTGLIT